MSTADPTGEVLRGTTIDLNGPGTVLRDFEALLEFIGPEGVRSTGQYHFLPMDRLSELDEKMACPLRPPLARPQQRSFPHINGLYLLLRTLELAVPQGRGKKTGRLMPNPEMLQQWRTLNPTERYFNLLESWWRLASAETMGERGGAWRRGMFFEERITWQNIPRPGQRIKDADAIVNFLVHGPLSAANLALFELFGLVEIDRGEPKEGENWRILAVRRTPFGEALVDTVTRIELPWLSMAIAGKGEETVDDAPDEEEEPGGDESAAVETDADEDEEELHEEPDEEPEEDEEEPPALGAWQPVLQPYFPEWRNNLHFPEPEYVDGVYYFKAKLGDVWRRIAIPADLTLDHLAWAIIDAYGFDGDHLFAFSFRDRDGTVVQALRPEGAEGPIGTDELSIGHLPLQPGDSMKFEYDFGASWRFHVTLEKIEPPNPKMKKPRVVEKHGKAPKEYDDQW